MALTAGNIVAFATRGRFFSIAAPGQPSLSVEQLTGTSIRATIDGDSGATNYLQIAAGTSDSWVDGGNRSGDGTIDITGLTAGQLYLLICHSKSGGYFSLVSDLAALTLPEADVADDRSTITSGGIIEMLTGGTLDQLGPIAGGLAASSFDPTPMLSGGTLDRINDEAVSPYVPAAYTDLDIKLSPKVLAIINKLGKTAIFHNYTEEVYDPTVGERLQGNSTDYSQKIIPPYEYALKYIDGDIIKVGDMQTGVASSGLEFEPRQGMKITIDEVVWQIIKTKPIYTGERIALYMLQLRK